MSNPDELSEILAKLRGCLPELRRRYGVRSLSVFGSRARRTSRSESDLDVLVEFDEAPGLLGFISLENELSELLGTRVDLVSAHALKPRLRPRILEEAVAV